MYARRTLHKLFGKPCTLTLLRHGCINHMLAYAPNFILQLKFQLQNSNSNGNSSNSSFDYSSLGHLSIAQLYSCMRTLGLGFCSRHRRQVQLHDAA